MGLEQGVAFAKDMFNGISITQSQEIIGLIVIILTLAMITRTPSNWVYLFLPVTVLWKINGIENLRLLLWTGALIFSISIFSPSVWKGTIEVVSERAGEVFSGIIPGTDAYRQRKEKEFDEMDKYKAFMKRRESIRSGDIDQATVNQALSLEALKQLRENKKFNAMMENNKLTFRREDLKDIDQIIPKKRDIDMQKYGLFGTQRLATERKSIQVDKRKQQEWNVMMQNNLTYKNARERFNTWLKNFSFKEHREPTEWERKEALKKFFQGIPNFYEMNFKRGNK